MFRVPARQGVVKNALSRNSTGLDACRALVQTRFYAQNKLGDLMNQSSINSASSSADSAPVKSDTSLSQRLRQRETGQNQRASADDFSEALGQITLGDNPVIKTPRQQTNRWDVVERGANRRRAEVKKRQLRTGQLSGNSFANAGEEEAFAQFGEEEIKRSPSHTGGRRTGRRAKAPLDTTLDKTIAVTPKKAVGAKRGPNRKSATLFGEGEEEQVGEENEEVDTDDILGQKEMWGDVDADTMRVLRQMMAWRNPVEAEASGEPALFHRIKSGYDIYSEERTHFKPNDTSATWGTNAPTTSFPNMLGGPQGNYKEFLSEEIKQLAPKDAASMKPADIVRFNLAKVVDITPRQRENVIAAVESILSNASIPSSRQSRA